jgi:hypothetical protein
VKKNGAEKLISHRFSFGYFIPLLDILTYGIMYKLKEKANGSVCGFPIRMKNM